MTAIFEPLNSSMCNGIALDGDHLLIRFSGGKVYRYLQASGEFTNVLTADSAGQYVNRAIKSAYECERAQEHES